MYYSPVGSAPLAGWIAASVHVVLAGGVSAHIILTKEDVRAAIGWTGLVWLTPVVGSLMYLFFGVNRISRRAGRMRGRPLLARVAHGGVTPHAVAHTRPAVPVPAGIPLSVQPIATLVGTVTGSPLALDCAVDPLVDGDCAYPAMLAAIDGATRSVALATYIFDRGAAGTQFVDALARAVERGVAVRVLIDGVGARYSHPPIIAALRARQVPVAAFLPPLIPIPHPYFNLRNHRKLMVVDGTIGFCGGMNIRDACLLALHRSDATQDLHFRIRGPVVRQLLSAFAFDWHFTTKEVLAGNGWWPTLGPAGSVAARGIPDGPDEDYETLLMTILGAVAQASRSIRIATPYFLPDPPLVDALRVAALRGVRVEIVLPEHGNLRLVQWAATAQLPQVLAWGCQVHLSRRPFDHSKVLIVDGVWSLIGSANWDPRSLRLNFEYGLECYSSELAGQLGAILDARIASGRTLTLEELERRSLPRRLRDGCAWLAQPYL
jgi:cardiolipin synthase